MDIRSLINAIRQNGYFALIALNLLAQFGALRRNYIGATLLPERLVPMNAYREYAIRYRTLIANDGTRYSPVQKKGNELVGDFLVELGESDIGAEISARDYDALMQLLNTQATEQATAQIINWSDVVLNRALLEHNEKQRWEAIVNAQVMRRGDNGYRETVQYSDPAGHRVNAGGQWSDPTYDPFIHDILPLVDMMWSKGFTVNRIFASRQIVTLLANNPKVQARAGGIISNVGGQLTVIQQRASLDAINNAFTRDGLPPIEEYNLQYRTQTGTAPFLARNVLVMVATTGQDETIDRGDAEPVVLTDTLGYVGVGRAAGQPTPGRVLRVEAFDNKPPRVEGEGWQTSLPVITIPEAIGVIGAIS